MGISTPKSPLSPLPFAQNCDKLLPETPEINFSAPFHNTPGHLHLYCMPMPSNSNRQSPTSFLSIPPTSPPLLHHNFPSWFINPTKRAAEKFSTLTALITTIATPCMGNLDKSTHWLLPYSRGVNQLPVVCCLLSVASCLLPVGGAH